MRFRAFGLILMIAVLPMGCSRFNSGHTLTASTTLTSTTLATTFGGSAIRDKAILAHGIRTRATSADVTITPLNLSGKCVSLLYAIQDQEDEGLVIFGNERPDIATSTANLFDFDFADQLAVAGSVSVKPGFIGGTVRHMVILFGHLDVTFQLGSSEKIVRIAMGDVEGMERGDIMLKVGNEFKWYDKQTGTFVTTRPTLPATLSAIADFVDPVRPNRHYYSMNINLTDTLTLSGSQVASANAISSVVDFAMSNFVILPGLASSSNITDAGLISNFSIAPAENGDGGDSGLFASANVTLSTVSQ